MRLSRIRALIMTAMGAPRGFFTQYPYLKQLAPVGETYPEVEGLCEQAPYRAFLDHMAGFREVFAGFGAQPTDPVLGRGMFPALDGMAAYAAIRGLKPRRIVEVGCGDSTYFLARATTGSAPSPASIPSRAETSGRCP